MSKEIKELLAQLGKCKDSASPQARSIRKKLREVGHYVSGRKKVAKKKDVKKAKKNGKAKAAKVVKPVNDEDDD